MTTRPLLHTLLVLTLPGVLACAHSNYQAPTPTVSKDGVAVSVVSEERCFITREDEKLPPPTNDNKFHLRLTVRFENNAQGVVGVATGQVRLAANGPGGRTEMSPLGTTTLTLQPSQSQIVPLDFERTGPLDCHQPLDLEALDAVKLADKPVELAPIRLVATH